MRRFPLLLKFIIGYVLFAALSIVVIATFTYRITYHSTLETKAAELRRIAQSLADESSRVFDGVSVTDAAYLEKLALISDFEDFDILMTDTTGRVLFDSSGVRTDTTITAYDPQQPGSYYSTGTWDGIFSEERLQELYLEQKKANTIVKGKKIGRNDPCPCGSGKKYKHCCGKAS